MRWWEEGNERREMRGVRIVRGGWCEEGDEKDGVRREMRGGWCEEGDREEGDERRLLQS